MDILTAFEKKSTTQFLKLVIACAIYLFISSFIQWTDTPKAGYVTDETTASKIAEAIWLPIFGEEINGEKPFRVELKENSVWIVRGTLNADIGGVAYIEIRKSDCKILKVSHGK